MRRLVLWGPVVLWMAAIFTVSSLSKPPSPPGLDDKSGHFLAYAGLGALTLRATSGGTLAGIGAGPVLTAWTIASIYGATDEFHQHFVPGRTADPADLGADALGAAAAVGVLWAFGILRRSRRPGAPSRVP